MSKDLISIEQRIENCIYLIRGDKVIIDEDLAKLYHVQTKVLVQAVKRNSKRFPSDFMFQLTSEEYDDLRSQFVTSSGKTGRRYPPYAFTEHGIAMLSSVLRSDLAIEVNIEIMRAFVKLRRILAEHQELRLQLESLERRYDRQFKIVFDAIRKIMEPKKPAKTIKIGFRQKKI